MITATAEEMVPLLSHYGYQLEMRDPFVLYTTIKKALGTSSIKLAVDAFRQFGSLNIRTFMTPIDYITKF